MFQECPADLLGVRFMLDADASPGLLPRLLAPFARRDLMPDRMWSHCTAGVAHIEIALHACPADLAGMVEGNLRQVVGVRSVIRVSAEAGRRAA